MFVTTELMHRILRQLTPEELAITCEVSRRWRTLSNDIYWRELPLELYLDEMTLIRKYRSMMLMTLRYPDHPKRVKHVELTVTLATKLSYEQHLCEVLLVYDMLDMLRHVTSCRIGFCMHYLQGMRISFYPALVSGVLNRLPNLQHLIINEIDHEPEVNTIQMNTDVWDEALLERMSAYRLKSLEVFWRIGMEDWQHFGRCLSAQQGLSTLVVQFGHANDLTAICALIVQAKLVHLRNLRFCFFHLRTDAQPEVFHGEAFLQVFGQLVACCTQLQSFKVYQPFESNEIAIPPWEFLAMLATLKLQVMDFNNRIFLPVEDGLPTPLHFDYMQEMELLLEMENDLHVFAGLAACFWPRLQRLSIQTSFPIARYMASLLDHCPILRELTIVDKLSTVDRQQVLDAIIATYRKSVAKIMLVAENRQSEVLPVYIQALRLACPYAEIHVAKGSCRVYYGVLLASRERIRECGCQYT